MKKKCIIIFVICVCLTVLLLLLTFCHYYKYSNWQTVIIPEGGTFKVPKNWVVTQEEHVIYITDRPITEDNYKIYLIGTVYDTSVPNPKVVHPYELFDDVKFDKEVYSRVFSNSALYLKKEYNISGDKETKYVFDVAHSKKYISFIAWDNLVDEKTMIKIAKSYRL